MRFFWILNFWMLNFDICAHYEHNNRHTIARGLRGSDPIFFELKEKNRKLICSNKIVLNM